MWESVKSERSRREAKITRVPHSRVNPRIPVENVPAAISLVARYKRANRRRIHVGAPLVLLPSVWHEAISDRKRVLSSVSVCVATLSENHEEKPHTALKAGRVSNLQVLYLPSAKSVGTRPSNGSARRWGSQRAWHAQENRHEAVEPISDLPTTTGSILSRGYTTSSRLAHFLLFSSKPTMWRSEAQGFLTPVRSVPSMSFTELLLQ